MNESTRTTSILVVDDIEKNLTSLEVLLRRPDLVLHKAANGRAALELLLEHRFALALIDVQMPEMDGYELAELMRGSPRTRDVPIIFVTATESTSQRTFRGYEAGAVDFIYKPMDPLVLQSKVDIFVRLWQQQQQLSGQLRALQDALRVNELFTAALGHDLRSPLQAILQGLELLESAPAGFNTAEVIRRVRSSSRRMAQMIDQLLELARMRAGSVMLTLQSADLRQIADQVVGEIDHREQVRMEVTGDTRGVWDAVRVAQVLSNLVSNGVQHGHSSSQVLVRIDGSAPAEVRVSVHNEGAIAAESLPRLFEPFYSTGAAQSRLGLGLYIVKDLTVRHGGDIGVSSSPELGTVFDVRLPRVTSLPDPQPAV